MSVRIVRTCLVRPVNGRVSGPWESTQKDFERQYTGSRGSRVLPKRAAKIREDLQSLPTVTIQQNKQFFDDVWNFCRAVIEASEQSAGQFVPSDPIM